MKWWNIFCWLRFTVSESSGQRNQDLYSRTCLDSMFRRMQVVWPLPWQCMATGADRQDSRAPKKENSASERAGFSDSVKRDQVGSRSDQNQEWHRPSTQIYTGVPHRVWKRQHACQIGRYTEANWELWRRHGSGTSTQVGQFYIQLSAINRIDGFNLSFMQSVGLSPNEL